MFALIQYRGEFQGIITIRPKVMLLRSRSKYLMQSHDSNLLKFWDMINLSLNFHNTMILCWL